MQGNFSAKRKGKVEKLCLFYFASKKNE